MIAQLQLYGFPVHHLLARTFEGELFPVENFDVNQDGEAVLVRDGKRNLALWLPLSEVADFVTFGETLSPVSIGGNPATGATGGFRDTEPVAFWWQKY